MIARLGPGHRNIFVLTTGRMELRALAPDVSVPASGRLLAVARQAHGTEKWALKRRDGDRTEWADGELAARAWLDAIAEDIEHDAKGDRCA